MPTASRRCALLALCLLLGACSRHHESPPVALPLNAAGPTICGGLLPRAVAETMADTKDLIISDSVRHAWGVCVVFRGIGKKEHVFSVTIDVYPRDMAAEAAYQQIGQGPPGTGSYRLPPTEGYGLVGLGTDGTKGRRGGAVTASGNVLLQIGVLYDARGRDAVADAHALLTFFGPKVAPDWPKPPPGIDPLNPTSPPPSATASAG